MSVPEAYAQFILDAKRNEEFLAAQHAERASEDATPENEEVEAVDLEDSEVFDMAIDLGDAA